MLLIAFYAAHKSEELKIKKLEAEARILEAKLKMENSTNVTNATTNTVAKKEN